MKPMTEVSTVHKPKMTKKLSGDLSAAHGNGNKTVWMVYTQKHNLQSEAVVSGQRDFMHLF